jgi:hypothetical protein
MEGVLHQPVLRLLPAMSRPGDTGSVGCHGFPRDRITELEDHAVDKTVHAWGFPQTVRSGWLA